MANFQFKTLVKSLFRKGSFVQNVSVISAGKLVVILISFAFIPILSRIYDPQAYGTFSLYSSIVTISVITIGLGFPSALVIIDTRHKFLNLVFVLLAGTIFFPLVYLAILILISFFIPVDLFYYLIAIGIFISGLINIFSGWNAREGAFKLGAFLDGSNNLIVRIVNLFLGVFFGAPVNGLIIGDLSGRAYASVINFYRFIRSEYITMRKVVSLIGIKEVAKEYSNYPKYIFSNQLMGQFAGHLPIYIITGFSGKAVLGFFSMSTSLLNVPAQLISTGIGTVFFKKATELKGESTEVLAAFTQKLYKSLFLLLVIPMSILCVFGEELLVFLLGDKWEQAGQFVSYMSVYFYLYLGISSTISIFQVIRREKWILLLNIVQIILTSLALLAGFYIFDSVEVAIQLYSFAMTIYLLLTGLLICSSLRFSFVKGIVRYFALFIGSVLILHGLKEYFL